jgi:hypothetical protein
MTQKVLCHMGMEQMPDSWNLHLAGFIQSGILFGMRCIAGTEPDGVTIQAGAWFTDRGDKIEEDADLANYFSALNGRPLTANATASPRYDLIVGDYFYADSPSKQATYQIVLGTPGAGEPPAWANDQFPLAIAVMAAGASMYSEFIPYPSERRYNCYLDLGLEYVRYGDQAAIKLMMVHEDCPVLDLVEGIYVRFVAAGTLADGALITAWLDPFTLTPDGELNIQQWIDEIIAARGNKSTLNDRLSVTLDDNGYPKAVGVIGTIQAEVVKARGNCADLDTRLDNCMTQYGYISHHMLAGMYGDIGSPGAPFYFTDKRATNSDHDARYYPRTEIDTSIAAMLYAIHGNGVLDSLAYLSSTVISGGGGTLRQFTFSSGSVLVGGVVVAVNSPSFTIDTGYTGTLFVSVDSTGAVVAQESDFATGTASIRIIKLTAGSIDVNVDARKLIAWPDRLTRNFIASATKDRLGLTTPERFGGCSFTWIDKLAIAEVTDVDGSGLSVEINASGSTENPFTEGMNVIFHDSDDAFFFRTVANAVGNEVEFTTGGLTAGKTGVLFEYRVIEDGFDFRDREIAIVGSVKELYADSIVPILPGETYAYTSWCGIGMIGGVLNNLGAGNPVVGRAYTSNGIAFTQAGWPAIVTNPGGAAMLCMYPGSETVNQGWRIFVRASDGALIACYSDAYWTGAKGAFVSFFVNFSCSPRLQQVAP